jgi:hypothetical protein
MAVSAEEVVKKINAVLQRYMEPYGPPSRDAFDGHSDGAVKGWLISSLEAIRRFAPPGSEYLAEAAASDAYDARRMELLAGILQALRQDYEDGLLVNLTELVHADLFDDFLDMAEHLLKSSYKDAAAVLAGGVLEEQLRKLAGKFGVATTKPSGEPEKPDTLNANLVKKGAYDKNELKQVTAWQGLRNDAAHGNYDAYVKDQVTVMILGLRGFVVRHPA